jgi:hypothetical protein
MAGLQVGGDTGGRRLGQLDQAEGGQFLRRRVARGVRHGALPLGSTLLFALLGVVQE